MTSRRLDPQGRLREAALFTVEGDGRFPVDMLRYDACWPHWEQDAYAITNDDYSERRRVVLETHRAAAPTARRWESQGWRVVGIGNLR
jgi:hypothetical protein